MSGENESEVVRSRSSDSLGPVESGVKKPEKSILEKSTSIQSHGTEEGVEGAKVGGDGGSGAGVADGASDAEAFGRWSRGQGDRPTDRAAAGESGMASDVPLFDELGRPVDAPGRLASMLKADGSPIWLKYEFIMPGNRFQIIENEVMKSEPLVCSGLPFKNEAGQYVIPTLGWRTLPPPWVTYPDPRSPATATPGNYKLRLNVSGLGSFARTHIVEGGVDRFVWIADDTEALDKKYGAGQPSSAGEAVSVIYLNDYQIANLRSIIEAIGYPWSLIPEPAPGPLSALNTGDWLGELYIKLPKVERGPNQSPSAMRQAAAGLVRDRSASNQPAPVIDADLNRNFDALVSAVSEQQHTLQSMGWNDTGGMKWSKAGARKEQFDKIDAAIKHLESAPVKPAPTVDAARLPIAALTRWLGRNIRIRHKTTGEEAIAEWVGNGYRFPGSNVVVSPFAGEWDEWIILESTAPGPTYGLAATSKLSRVAEDITFHCKCGASHRRGPMLPPNLTAPDCIQVCYRCLKCGNTSQIMVRRQRSPKAFDHFFEMVVMPEQDMAASAQAALKAENERLKRGDFTPDELQNLCHNLSADDAEAFCKGCEQYQIKLFGKSPLTAAIAERDKLLGAISSAHACLMAGCPFPAKQGLASAMDLDVPAAWALNDATIPAVVRAAIFFLNSNARHQIHHSLEPIWQDALKVMRLYFNPESKGQVTSGR